MLIIKAFVNEREIDEIYVWNTGQKVDQYDETYEYRILKPKGYEDIPIYHNRKNGWKNLMKLVLIFLEDKEHA